MVFGLQGFKYRTEVIVQTHSILILVPEIKKLMNSMPGLKGAISEYWKGQIPPLEAASILSGFLIERFMAFVQVEDRLRTLEHLESVREDQTGLQSFRSMRRIEARRKNASALRLRFSQSLASLRQRLSQARVRSTIQRLGRTANPF